MHVPEQLVDGADIDTGIAIIAHHGVGLTSARLTVRQDAHVVAVAHGGQQRRSVLEHLFLHGLVLLV